ncbi:hypothetical protein, unknown function [Leishmania tarentolae]|uniref:Uncharacterized protein n=1 Tax=Leishmania tarentolae TaxID=5689 RepID=A0A640KDV6_LEITA|nr:hypothetical protein, unknown function [Leishmania tarentolae]
MRAYIDSICNRKPPSTAPQVRPTRSALLLLARQEARKRQLSQLQADGSPAVLKHPQPHVVAAKRPLESARSLASTPRHLACRSPPPLAREVLARTPAASSAAAVESPWHPLFTPASLSPVTSPRQQQRPVHRKSEEGSNTDATREEHWSVSTRPVNTGKGTAVAVAAYGGRRLHEDTAEEDKGGNREADIVHASTTEKGECTAESPTRAWRAAWVPWNPPSHKEHHNLVQGDASWPLPRTGRLRYPSPSSLTYQAPHTHSEMGPPRTSPASAARSLMTSGTPSRIHLATLSGLSPTSPARSAELHEPPQLRLRCSAPQQQQAAAVQESYSSPACCTSNSDVIANRQRQPDSPPCHPSLSSLFSSGFFNRGSDGAIHRRAEQYAKVTHPSENSGARFSAKAQSADRRCRDMNNCSLRDLQKELYTRLQRQLHDLAPSASSSTSPMASNAAAGGTPSTPRLADPVATLRLWRDTRRALRQHVMHRSAIHSVQHSTSQRGPFSDVKEDIVTNDVDRHILAERAASRAYLLADAAAANTKQCGL